MISLSKMSIQILVTEHRRIEAIADRKPLIALPLSPNLDIAFACMQAHVHITADGTVLKVKVVGGHC